MDYRCQEMEQCYGQLCHEEDRHSRPSYQFWNYFVIGQSESGNFYQDLAQNGLGYPKWDLLVALYLGWLLVTLMTLKGMRILSKIISVSVFLALFLLIVLIVVNDKSREIATYIKIFGFHPIEEIMEWDLWSRAACFTAKSLAVAVGVLSGLSSYSR